ncbi:MAG: GNAT family N-acetyltransferase [Candidatus Paceibacteria bacterium]
MKTEIVSREQWREHLENLPEFPKEMVTVILFGGERLHCIDEAVIGTVDEQLIGAATIAPEGQEHRGDPEIVGLYVRPGFRREGYGTEIFRQAVHRCRERGWDQVKVQVISSDIPGLIEKLPQEDQELLHTVEAYDGPVDLSNK